MKAILISLLCATLTCASITEAIASKVEIDSPGQFTLLPCVNKSDIDCIESFTYSYPKVKSTPVQLVKKASGSTQDKFGQDIENSMSGWSFIDNLGSSRSFSTVATLSSEKYMSPAYNKFYPSLWFYIYDMQRFDVEAGLKFQVIFRTSWLKPVNAAAYGRNADLVQKTIQGGSTFTFTGSPFLSTSFLDSTKYGQLGESGSTMKSDSEHPTLYFLIDHASSIPNGSMYDARCAYAGYTFESSNGIAAGQPTMDSPDSLNFVIYAPHFFSDGTLNTGFFSANIHKDYLDCMFPGNTLTKYPEIAVSITDSDGSKQVATTSSTIQNGIYKIRASGFHFSAPRIVVTGVASSTPAPAPSASAKSDSVPMLATKKTISCVKGKVVKKVTGAIPKCPTGYKKK